MRRKTRGQPITKETARKKNPARGGLALTSRVTQYQAARAPPPMPNSWRPHSTTITTPTSLSSMMWC